MAVYLPEVMLLVAIVAWAKARLSGAYVVWDLEKSDNSISCSCLFLSPGLSFQDFYQQCREAFLVNSELTLRAQLTEFRDHKLIRTKRVSPGKDSGYSATLNKKDGYLLLSEAVLF